MPSAPRTHKEEAPKPAFMQRALELAQRGLEYVSPNPLVGAVVVRGGKVISEGYHRRFGGPHAEVDALRRSPDPRGADLYVTLEPCGHHGKTPPCANAILEAGVRRVIYGARDPNPATSGKGPRLLRSRGVTVTAGCLRKECEEINAPFFHWIQTGLPWVLLKWAMTLDGKTATASGESQWITGKQARTLAHGMRRRVDAVMVGTETALRDDPLLTPRPARGRKPARIVLDRRGRLPLKLRLLSGKSALPGGGPVIYVTSSSVSPRRRSTLQERGAKVVTIPFSRRDGGIASMLKTLGALGISQILVEGGATLGGSFLAAGHVREVAAFVACRLLGGRDARGALEGPGISLLADSPWLAAPRVQRLGPDLLVQGRLR